MGTLSDGSLQEFANTKTNTQPAMALGSLSGEPSYLFAWKGPNNPDQIHLSGVTEVTGTSTDVAPALAILDVYLTETLYLAWKVAGSNAVKVLQCVLAEDGQPIIGKWEALPAAKEKSSEPGASTDASPALAVGAGNKLYLVWKTVGKNAQLAWSVYDGSGWSTPVEIPQATTNTGPALAAYNNMPEGGPWPLCLAWMGATDNGVHWSSFTPGSATFNQSVLPGVTTDATPALTTAFVQKSYFIVWKGKGEATVSFALLAGQFAGATTTLTQVGTNFGPAAVTWPDNSLIVAWKGKTTDNVWKGIWTV